MTLTSHFQPGRILAKNRRLRFEAGGHFAHALQHPLIRIQFSFAYGIGSQFGIALRSHLIKLCG